MLTFEAVRERKPSGHILYSGGKGSKMLESERMSLAEVAEIVRELISVVAAATDKTCLDNVALIEKTLQCYIEVRSISIVLYWQMLEVGHFGDFVLSQIADSLNSLLRNSVTRCWKGNAGRLSNGFK